DDMWFQWVIDMGYPGADRGEGGRYLILPPDYKGIVPESGFHVGKSRTTRVMAFARYFLENNEPKPVVERIKKLTKIYPYVPGEFGTPVADILAGGVPLSGLAPPATRPETKFIDASGKAPYNTIPASDYRFYEQLNRVVQAEPATSFDPELL